MQVVRSKYRTPAIQPELRDGKEGVTMSLAKKEKPPEEDPYGADIAKQRQEKPVVFLASHTQVKRQELVVRSDEEAYRQKHYPTIFERIELQKDWAKQQQQAARLVAEREAVQMRIDKMRRERNGQALSEDEEALLEDIEEQTREIGEEDEREFETNKKKTSTAEYAQQIMEIKEHKVLAMRDTAAFHREYSLWARRKKAIKISLGLTGRREKDYSVILPWLLLGRRELSANMQELLKLNVTHILNVTHDAPNVFGQHFVYEKIRVKDSLDSDIGCHFDTIVNFIDRAEACKGRILVHCNAGASRAPTAVIAYLLAKKGITLEDAYNYVLRMRPVIYPNRRFLFQLAMLEVKLFESCSVYYHDMWRFYEFNVFRSQLVDERDRLGMYATVMKLYSSEVEEEEDLFSQTQAAGDNSQGRPSLSLSLNLG